MSPQMDEPYAGERFVIVLMHPNQDRRIVPVEHVAETYVTIRWGQSGLYDLNLLRNTLSPRSGSDVQSNGRGKAKWYKKDRPLWQAEDIEKVRDMVKERLGKKAEERMAAEAKAKHEASMP